MKTTSLALSLIFATTAASAAHVAPSVNPGQPHFAGQPAIQAEPTVTLSAYASTKVPSDEMVVSLQVDREGTNLGALNQAVLSELQSALSQAKSVSGVRARLGNVRTHQTYSPQGKAIGWRVYGEVVLDSKKLKELGDLTGHLSQKLQLSSVAFRLSDEKKLELEQSLLTNAAQAFQAKAKASAKALGFETFRIKEVSVSQGMEGGRPVMPMVADSMVMRKAVAASVPTEAGESEVSVTLSGSVTLR